MNLFIIWNTYGFEIIVIVSILFICLVAVIYKIIGKKGTYSNDKFDFNSINRKDLLKPIKRNKSKNESKGEGECRRVLQKIFNKPFKSERPDFLRNPVTGKKHNLELDCYNSELKLAVEYNGVQHYKYVKFFHKNYEHFLNQKYRDEMKRNMCKNNGIILIEVPNYVNIENIENFIITECKKHGYVF